MLRILFQWLLNKFNGNKKVTDKIFGLINGNY